MTLFVQIFAFFSRKVAPSYLSSLLAVQASYVSVWVTGTVCDLERLCIYFSPGLKSSACTDVFSAQHPSYTVPALFTRSVS